MALKLSVIVPIYNAATLLPRCLDSILAQELKEEEYEVLLINDGSTDQSLAVCEAYQRKHPQTFRLVSQQNSGVSAARNKGIALARGCYVCFVDADDFLAGGGIVN